LPKEKMLLEDWLIDMDIKKMGYEVIDDDELNKPYLPKT